MVGGVSTRPRHAEVVGLVGGFAACGWEFERVSSEFWESEDGSQRMLGR